MAAFESVKIGVVIATKGRPACIPFVLRALEAQTLAPTAIVFSGNQASDVAGAECTTLPVRVVLGSAGSSVQRNRGLDAIANQIDVVIFFDDDFAPSSFWIERCARLFASHPEIVGLSGNVLMDGAKDGSITWEEAKRLNDLADARRDLDERITACLSTYGCNMAFRLSALGASRFDERLVLYGWLEDKDLSRRVGRGRMLVRVSSLTGVHLGLHGGRVRGRSLGYSQVVNAWYLRKKGVLTRREALSNIVRALAANSIKSFKPEPHIDRRGRLVGNLIGYGELLSGNCRPERAARI